MADLISLQCPNCAGRVDRATLTCNSCGLQFKMKSDGTLMRVDVFSHNFIPIGAAISMPAFYVKDNPEKAMEYTLEKMAHKLAEQLLPLMEYRQEYNMEHDDFVTYGRIRVEEPEFKNKDFDTVKRFTDESDICDLNDWHNDLVKRIDDLSNKNSILSDRYTEMTSKINRMDNDITAAKSLAETAKRRTEVDYTQMSKVKNDAEIIQDVYNRMAGRGATKEELDNFRNVIHKYDALEKKEIPIIKKMCETCRYDDGKLMFAGQPCKSCNHNNKWEAKDNG